MNFFQLNDFRINLDTITHYYTHETHETDYQTSYYIVFKTIGNECLTIYFSTEKERNDALQELDNYTTV